MLVFPRYAGLAKLGRFCQRQLDDLRGLSRPIMS